MTTETTKKATQSSSSTSQKLFLVLIGVVLVFFLYQSVSRPAAEDVAKVVVEKDVKVAQPVAKPTAKAKVYEDPASKLKIAKVAKELADQHAKEYASDYHILFILTKIDEHPNLKDKAALALTSIFEHAHFEKNETFHTHFVCDPKSREFIEQFVQENVHDPGFVLKIHFIAMEKVAKVVNTELPNIGKIFGQTHDYYKDALFYMSLFLHEIMPSSVHRLVQLDLDVKLRTNIRELWHEFEYFDHNTMVSLAYDNQPVYKTLLWKYRRDNPRTSFGWHKGKGFPGYNSGVTLVHLDHIRLSEDYRSYLSEDAITELIETYSFKGHLGDQDFYTLLGHARPEFFHTLPCGWNRQLCQWWKTHGGYSEEVFNRYYNCDEETKIYHGNCNTPIPED